MKENEINLGNGRIGVIEFIEGGVGVTEMLLSLGIAIFVQKTLDAISGDDNHGWYCIITEKGTGLNASCWGATKHEAKEKTIYAIKNKIEDYDEEKERHEYQIKRQREENEKRLRQQQPRSSPSYDFDENSCLGKLLGYALLAAAVIWLIFSVAVPLLLINIAAITLIAGLIKKDWRDYLFILSVFGAVYIILDLNNGWATKALVSNVSFFSEAIPVFFYVNIAAGIIAAYFLIRNFLNGYKPQAENEGEFSKRNLILMGCLFLVGSLTIGLQNYFDNQNFHSIQSSRKANTITYTRSTNSQTNERSVRDGAIENVVQPTSTGYVQTLEGSNLRLRSHPSLDAQIIAGIPNGTTIEILGYSDHVEEVNGEIGKWCHINFNGKIGWAWGGFIKNN